MCRQVLVSKPILSFIIDSFFHLERQADNPLINMQEINPIKNKIADLKARSLGLRGYL